MNIEEKAKLYADWVIQAIGRKRTISSDRIANDFTAGYTQAVTDLSVENEKLREALSLAYDLIRDSTEYEVEIPRYIEGLLKINELLKPNN